MHSISENGKLCTFKFHYAVFDQFEYVFIITFIFKVINVVLITLHNHPTLKHNLFSFDVKTINKATFTRATFYFKINFMIDVIG